MFVEPHLRPLAIKTLRAIALRDGAFGDVEAGKESVFIDEIACELGRSPEVLKQLTSDFLNRSIVLDESATIFNERPEWSVAKEVLDKFGAKYSDPYDRGGVRPTGKEVRTILEAAQSLLPDIMDSEYDVIRSRAGFRCKFKTCEYLVEGTINLTFSPPVSMGATVEIYSGDEVLVGSFMVENAFLEGGLYTVESLAQLENEICKRVNWLVALQEYLSAAQQNQA